MSECFHFISSKEGAEPALNRKEDERNEMTTDADTEDNGRARRCGDLHLVV